VATLVSVLVRDVIANRPAAGIAGRRFLATDTGVEYHDDGSAWQAVTTDAGQITSGTLAAARLPNPSSSSLGGVRSIASSSHQFLTSISTSGVPAAAQPTEADLSLSDITTNNVSTTKHGLAPKAPNDATQYLDGTGAYSVPPGSAAGTVTSVALTVPSWLSVSGTPVTTSGTLAVTATSGQTANRFLATPDGSTGAAGLRAIAAGDLPLATTGAFGAVKPDGTTITISGGVITSTASGGMTNPMTTAGDVIYGGASGTPTRLAAGTSGYVLTSNGAGVAPSYQASSGGAIVKLSETILGSTAATVTFSSISGSYKHLQLIIKCRCDQSSPTGVYCQFNADTAANYDYTTLFSNSATPGSNLTNSAAQPILAFATGTAAPSGQATTIVVDIPDYARAVWNKEGLAKHNRRDSTTVMTTGQTGFNWHSNSAITSIVIGMATGNFAVDSIFSLYGVS
jgi:hypothetical protein